MLKITKILQRISNKAKQIIISDLNSLLQSNKLLVISDLNIHHTETKTYIVINDFSCLRKCLLPFSELRIGEAYAGGQIDILGKLEDVLDYFVNEYKLPKFTFRFLRTVFLVIIFEFVTPPKSKKNIQHHFSTVQKRDTMQRDGEAIGFHYDRDVNFFNLFLDKNLVYSCGIFLSNQDNLEQSQLNKFKIVCDKLELHPGDKILDIGCGWGGLVVYIAKNYDVDVVGITLSSSQKNYVEEIIKNHQLEDRCRVECLHYDQLPDDVLYNKILSIGMVEHIGRQIDNYFDKVYKILENDGKFLLQGGYAKIDRSHIRSRMFSKLGGNEFIHKYFYPDSHLIDLPTLFYSIENVGFEMLSLESLTDHYPKTINSWLENFRKNHTSMVDIIGEFDYRVWYLMFTGYLTQIKKGKLIETQILLRN